MRRVVSLWLPTWPTDRLRRRQGGAAPPPAEAPLVRTRTTDAASRWRRRTGRRRRSACARACRSPQAQAMVPGLEVAEADPAGDAAALADLAAWCLRYSPLTAPDPPDGVWIDATGCTELHGGEQGMLDDLVRPPPARRHRRPCRPGRHAGCGLGGGAPRLGARGRGPARRAGRCHRPAAGGGAAPAAGHGGGPAAGRPRPGGPVWPPCRAARWRGASAWRCRGAWTRRSAARRSRSRRWCRRRRCGTPWPSPSRC